MKQNKDQIFPCPCCGEFTLSEKGAYEICPVCFWEDDPVQLSNPSYAGGANAVSLIQARENWLVQKFFSVNKIQ
jgi:hypothetical protein